MLSLFFYSPYTHFPPARAGVPNLPPPGPSVDKKATPPELRLLSPPHPHHHTHPSRWKKLSSMKLVPGAKKSGDRCNGAH